MNFRLGHERFPAWFEANLDFGLAPPLIRHFMDHHEGQGEVGLGLEAEPILLTPMKSNPICDSGDRRPLPQHVQHHLLEIDGDHKAVVPNVLRHRHRAEAPAAAHVHRRHARHDVGADDLFRGVKKASTCIINEVSAQPWTKVRYGRSRDDEPIIVESLLD